MFQPDRDFIPVKDETLVLCVPEFNIINGGLHAGNKLAMKKFMILPVPVGASYFREAMKMCVKVYHNLLNML
ncbi:Enolase [Artemisia annua]|uniref:phosphopyruvate hydratase n=1 Tax=Artemisia annua TaxID=35608 RepID=A0A2U1Q5Q7_ARTAN|nr:Enolase [Artemisia annua]